MSELKENESEQVGNSEEIIANNSENTDDTFTDDVLDYNQVRDYVHKVSNKPVVTKPKYSAIDQQYEIIDKPKRQVNLPKIESVKTIYECNVCGTLLNEKHFYSRSLSADTLETITEDIELPKLRRSHRADGLVTTQSINTSCLVKPLYQLADEHITDYFEPMDTTSDTDIPTVQKSKEKLINNKIIQIENEISKSNYNFMKYTSGLNRIPPLYSGSLWGNCFNSMTRPGALPHISKNGIYYRVVDYSQLTPDYVLITITNPKLVKRFRRSRRFPRINSINGTMFALGVSLCTVLVLIGFIHRSFE
ncbi:hypothetical protein O3M35_006004 [Rhynocoris fuscipes]|uniref:Uncharacterized protein n=1 Tax=Rhynocoris fuscipes TaxID=488301 RepID=A0AAW1DFD9_9HEMI